MANKPEIRFQFGAVSASVFANDAKRGDGTTFQSRKTVLQVTYRDDQGNFKTASGVGVNDLPKAIAVLVQAYLHCLAASKPDANE